jgi:hypothetical protein
LSVYGPFGSLPLNYAASRSPLIARSQLITWFQLPLFWSTISKSLSPDD